jgi:hypothetical protein
VQRATLLYLSPTCWRVQGELLKKGTKLGVCTPNPTACGKAEKGACCISDIPNIGQVGQCMSHQPPGAGEAGEGGSYPSDTPNIGQVGQCVSRQPPMPGPGAQCPAGERISHV